MPVTLLDLIVIGVMLVSGLLAMVRGLLREVFSIVSWVAAAGVAVYFYPQLLPVTKQYVTQDTVALAVTIGILFLGTLLIVSIISARISDIVLDSRIGALDRTLGFLFGLARGLLVMVVAFLFFNWLVPEKSQPPWALNAKSRPVLQNTGNWLVSLLPDDPENTILKRLRRTPGEDGETPAAPGTVPGAVPGGQRSDGGSTGGSAGGTTVATGPAANAGGNSGYRRGDRQGFDQLLESTRGAGQ
ncbi:CvpA family protein [Aquabacter spiritensis]|uniref:Membrane protein required for colicin V production n=1 Tax=Aquabacter spiritensis TaxID=933073 RepID=A0A4R3LX18_9HYPH|nr:CvpA family protein [Aquabacter spiritensis]TCT05184.1 membrane protein required for colicin V production [Aquabacter spiritensis]